MKNYKKTVEEIVNLLESPDTDLEAVHQAWFSCTEILSCDISCFDTFERIEILGAATKLIDIINNDINEDLYADANDD